MRTLANAAHKLKRRGGRTAHALPTLWLMTDETRLPDPLLAVAALPRGSAVILRHYGDSQRKIRAQQISRLCRARGLTFIIAGDWRLAAQTRAHGVHLPEYLATSGLPPGARLWRRAGQRLLTVAVHGATGLRRAAAIGASAAVLAPVFITRSHPGRAALGARKFGGMARAADVPVIALGGINQRTIVSLLTSGCSGVAGIGFSEETVKRS